MESRRYSNLGVPKGPSKRRLVLALVGGLLVGPACGDDSVSTNGTVSSGESATGTSVGVSEGGTSSTGEVTTTTSTTTGGGSGGVTSETSSSTTMDGTESGTMTEGPVCPDGGEAEDCRPTGVISVDCDGGFDDNKCVAGHSFTCFIEGGNFTSVNLIDTNKVNDQIVHDISDPVEGSVSCTFSPIMTGLHQIRFEITGPGGTIEIEEVIDVW